MSAAVPGPVDASQLLRLTSDPARVVVALFVFSNFLYAFSTLDEVKNAFPVLAAMAIVNAAAILIVLDAPDPFPMVWTWAIVIAVAVSTVLVAFQLPDVGPARARELAPGLQYVDALLSCAQAPSWVRVAGLFTHGGRHHRMVCSRGARASRRPHVA